MENIYQNKTGVDILMPYKVDFQKKPVLSWISNFIMIKR